MSEMSEMTKAAVQAIVFEALRSLNLERAEDQQIEVAEDTRLFGADAQLDSLSLVSVIVDVETAISDQFGVSISLTDDQALAQSVSPFSSVKSLVAYVLSCRSGHST